MKQIQHVNCKSDGVQKIGLRVYQQRCGSFI